MSTTSENPFIDISTDPKITQLSSGIGFADNLNPPEDSDQGEGTLDGALHVLNKMLSPTVEFQNASQSFPGPEGTIEVVKDITFKAQGNETIAILGPSGCGKSTLLRMISGMHPRGLQMPTAGQCIIDGEEVLQPHDDVLTVFQTPVLSAWKTVLGNVMLSFKPWLFGPRSRAPWELAQDFLAGFPGLKGRVPYSEPTQEIRERSLKILEAVGLGDSLHKYPHQLSGGMRQRAALACSLVVGPPILCMDEPFSALDPATRVGMRDLVRDLKDKYPCLIFFVTHDVGEALDLADRIIVLSTGPATVLRDIRLPSPKPAGWVGSPEHDMAEQEILHLIRSEARETNGHGALSMSV